MRRSGFIRVVTEFLKRTTLHGFKYLTSRYFYDCVLWALVCVISTCCAGGLCAALWARFLQQPALLTLQRLRNEHADDIPLTVCSSPDLITQTLFGVDCESSPNSTSLSTVLKHVIRRKPLKGGEGEMLDNWLLQKNTNLAEALFKSTPECDALLTYCRWQILEIPCRELFYKEITEWGACCVLNRTMLRNPSKYVEMTSRLDLALRCSNSTTDYGCEMFIEYEEEAGVEPESVILQQGLEYTAQLVFAAMESGDDRLDGEGECVRDRGYSRDLCWIKCRELLCGCLHPLMFSESQQLGFLPACTVAQISCLQSSRYDSSCACPPPCVDYVSDLRLQSSPMEFLQYALDPLYAGLDSNTSTVLHMRLRLRSSKVFALLATESWLTLLSSLGGVFNMFLGFGLFSALEIIVFFLIKLPIALKSSTEMLGPAAH